MYGSKRLAKRSIIGTRVCAPWPDGIYYPGKIRNMENRSVYTICFDDGYTKAFREADIVGQGFRGVGSVHLKFGQKVFITNNGREMVGHVQKHKKPTNEVFIKIADSSETMIQRKLDEVRLMESRKSPRLADHETNYLKLADMSPTSDAKKRNVSSSIDVPSAKSFKVEDEPMMNDVMAAAMVLTSLSGSPLLARMDSTSVPYSPTSPTGGATSDLSMGTASSYSPSSSGHFSWDFHSRGTPSPTSSTSDVECNAPGFSFPEIGSTNGVVFDQLSVDEGIDMSEVGALCTVDDIPAKKLKLAPTRTAYKCTWPGCGKTLCKVQGIEKHIRSQHLRTKDSSYNDHEEEFYYTEIETTVDSMSDMFADMYTSSPPPTLSHMDMVRPPHEDPRDSNGNSGMCLDRVVAQLTPMSSSNVTMFAPLSQVPQQTTFTWQTTHPTTITPLQTNGQYSSPIRKTSIVQQRQQSHQAASPKTHLHFAPSAGSGSAPSQGHHNHHHPKTREGKKCRKVYGMERKDLWCTQCRWKKACVRFTC
ncbi:zinc finger protein 704-like isoform X2 [Patiria miniata]|uniref:C2H2-type domain-containing protein n=1 Tax=Patiria miniata TaxID=46514 RepID=A0A913ZHR4_PATMI|nr:zinc finger protein 704-like isoform X2 [Patiria miniata]